MKTLVVALALTASACAPSVMDRAVQLSPTTNYEPTPGAEMQPAFDSLKGLLEKNGYTVRILTEEQQVQFFGGTAYGFHLRPARTIFLDAGSTPNTQFETLAHEAGHIFHSEAMDRGTAEVFAELVGNRVQRFYGSKTALKTSSDYLAKFKHLFAAVPFIERDMDFAVAALTGKATWPAMETPEQ